MSAAGNGSSAAAGEEGAPRSFGQLVATATSDASSLLHDEIALLKAEVRDDVRKASVGGTALGLATTLLLFGIPVLSFAGAYGLHALGLGLAWSFLIVFGVHVVLALVIGVYGLKEVKKVKRPEKSISSARDTAEFFSGYRPGATPPADRRETAPGVTRSPS